MPFLISSVVNNERTKGVSLNLSQVSPQFSFPAFAYWFHCDKNPTKLNTEHTIKTESSSGTDQVLSCQMRPGENEEFSLDQDWTHKVTWHFKSPAHEPICTLTCIASLPVLLCLDWSPSMVRIIATDSLSLGQPSTLLPLMSQAYIGSCHLLTSFRSFLLSGPCKACEDLALPQCSPLSLLLPTSVHSSHVGLCMVPLTCDALFGFHGLSWMFLSSPFVPRLFPTQPFNISPFIRSLEVPPCPSSCVHSLMCFLPHCFYPTVLSGQFLCPQRGSEFCEDHEFCCYACFVILSTFSGQDH